ncbi:MAG TPA: cation-transporting P-type ATPase, partial [Candidatus Kapabacteria bacterium]|nr:cation-transporting P-type ATPase [Candidatus Kapabacteria bacterium]
MNSRETSGNPVKTHGEAYRKSIERVLIELQTNSETGLKGDDVRRRLDEYGRNELTAEAPVPGWKKFLAQFKDVLVVLLLIATGISAGLWLMERNSALPYEAIAIFAVVLLNAIMGYVQESKAESAVAALRKMSAAHAKVVRDGKQQTILAAEIVPG